MKSVTVLLSAFCFALVGGVAGPLHAETIVTATWNDATGNWTTASDWNCPSSGVNCVPNNTSSTSYDVFINTLGANVTLDDTSTPSSVAINTLSLIQPSPGPGCAPPCRISQFLQIENGASLSVAGDVSVVATVSNVILGVDDALHSSGGSSLRIGGNLILSNYEHALIEIGSGSGTSPTTVTVAGTFENTGDLEVQGGNTAAAHALLSVAGAAPSTLTGQFGLGGLTGGAAVEYGSGEITQIGSGTTGGDLSLNGPNAFMELSKAPGSNSALVGLRTIASNGGLFLDSQASLSTTGPLVNDGGVFVSGVGSLLSVGGAAPSTLTGTWDALSGGTIEFASGGITQIGDGTTQGCCGPGRGELDLWPNSFTELSSAPGSNSALTGLRMIASNGELDVFGGGASLSTEGPLVNNGDVLLLYGGSLSVGGNLTSRGNIETEGTLTAPTVDIAGGELFGNDTVDGDLVNRSVVSPSFVGTPAMLTINGSYTQKADGTLLIDISGATDFSVLDVTGEASLDGTAKFDFLNGYVPGANTDFPFLEAGSVIGDFASLDFIGIKCATCTFDLSTLSLDTGSTAPSPAVPEPGTLVFFATGLLALGSVLRRKSRHVSW
jgi:PEP-CTERM motif